MRKTNYSQSVLWGFLFFACGWWGSSQAEPCVLGTITRRYANVKDPQHMAFGTNHVMYVGRDNSGSGGGSGDAVTIHRVEVGGSLVNEFGDSAIWDPDAVIVDRTGAISGVAGAVLVGGVFNNLFEAYICSITPSGHVSTLFGPTTTFKNPADFAFDNNGRLLFPDSEGQQVMVSTGNVPVALMSTPTGDWPQNIEVDQRNRVWVGFYTGKIRIYSSSGSLLDTFAGFAPGGPLAHGEGGVWGTDMYSVNTTGDLLRITMGGVSTVVGTGFIGDGGIDILEFHGDTLYAADFAADLIYSISQPPPLKITEIGLGTSNTHVVCWTPIGGDVVYTVSCCTNLSDPVWEPASPQSQWPITALVWTNTANAEAASLFYRVSGAIAK